MHTDVLLAACCDVNEDRARGFQLEFGFKKYYTDMFEMLEKEKPDAVCLVVPVELTAKLASGVLERGFPLILEKPPGRTKEETMGLIEIARRKAVPNRVAFNRRFAPLTRALKKCLDDHFRPEDIQNINCEMFRVARTDSDFSTTAIHAVDAVKFLAASEYSGIRFRYHELPRIGAGVANIFMDCTFASGADAFFTISPVTGVSVERITINLLGNTFFLHSSMYSDYDYPGKLVHLRDNKLIFEATGKGISDGKEAFEALGSITKTLRFSMICARAECLNATLRPRCNPWR